MTQTLDPKALAAALNCRPFPDSSVTLRSLAYQGTAAPDALLEQAITAYLAALPTEASEPVAMKRALASLAEAARAVLKTLKPGQSLTPAGASLTNRLDSITAEIEASLATRPATVSSAVPVAWIVERDGKTYLPFIRSREEMERYVKNNPDERLLALYTSPQDRDAIIEECAKVADKWADEYGDPADTMHAAHGVARAIRALIGDTK